MSGNPVVLNILHNRVIMYPAAQPASSINKGTSLRAAHLIIFV